MINWLSAYANNIGDTIFWPLVVLTAVGAVVMLWSELNRQLTKYGDPEYGVYKWRLWTWAQGLLIGWIVWGVLASVPEPNYLIKERIVERPVIKQVKVPVEKIVYRDRNAHLDFERAYDDCMGNWKGPTKEIADRCQDQAYILTFPGLKMITTTVYKPDPYKELYNTCMGGWSVGGDKVRMPDGKVIDGAALRQLRIEMCHKHAMEVRAKGVAG